MIKTIKGWWSAADTGWDEYFLRCNLSNNKHRLNLCQTRLDEAEAAHRLSTAWLRREVEGLSEEIAKMEKGLGK